jgi:hypothetical protein
MAIFRQPLRASGYIAVLGLEMSAYDVACEERDSHNDDNIADLLCPIL